MSPAPTASVISCFLAAQEEDLADSLGLLLRRVEDLRVVKQRPE